MLGADAGHLNVIDNRDGKPYRCVFRSLLISFANFLPRLSRHTGTVLFHLNSRAVSRERKGKAKRKIRWRLVAENG